MEAKDGAVPAIHVALWGFDPAAVAAIDARSNVVIRSAGLDLDDLRRLLEVEEFDVVGLFGSDSESRAVAVRLVRERPPACAVLVVGEDSSRLFPDASMLAFDVWHEPNPDAAVEIFRPLLRSIGEREALAAVRSSREVANALDAIFAGEREVGDAVEAAMGAIARSLDCMSVAFWRPSPLGRSLIRVGCTGPDPALDRAVTGGDRVLDPGCDRLLELPIDGTPAGEVLRTGRPSFPDGADQAVLLPARSNGRIAGIVALTGAPNVARRRTSFELAAAAADRVAAFVQWHLAEQQLNALILGSSSGIVVLDSTGNVVSINQAALTLLQTELDRALDHNVRDLLEESWWQRHGGQLARRAQAAETHSADTVEICLVCANGQALDVDLSISAWGTGGDRRVAITLRDISSRKRAERRVTELAFTDRETGAPNAAALTEHLEHLKPEASGLVIIEIKRFRRLIETLGADGAAETLAGASRRLAHALDATGRLFRLDGERFAASIPRTGDGELMHIARRLQTSLTEPLEIRGAHLHLYPTIAVTAVHPAAAAGDAIDRAHRALAHARRAGDEHPHLYDAEHPPDADILHRDAELHQAVSARQLELHYQPIVDLQSGRIVAAEALVRWRHPTLGLIPPGMFLDLAEQSGFIREIGIWVAVEACRQLAVWSPRHPQLRLSFNVSPRQLLDTELVKTLADAAAAHGVDPRRLTAEIIETSAVRDLRTARGTIHALKDLGLRVALDDFGVGESSLGRLNDMSFDTLKIDRSLIQHLPHDRVGRALTQAAVQLAQGLEVTSVVEGIERPEQAAYVTELGADLGQGYFYARPLPEAEFGRLLATHSSLQQHTSLR